MAGPLKLGLTDLANDKKDADGAKADRVPPTLSENDETRITRRTHFRVIREETRDGGGGRIPVVPDTSFSRTSTFFA